MIVVSQRRSMSAFICLTICVLAPAMLLPVPQALTYPLPKGEHKPGDVVEVEIARGVKMKFCWVPPGKAMLSSPRFGEKEHEYTCRGFWLGKYTVTQGDWEAVMGNNPSWFSKTGRGKKMVAGIDTSRFPVEQVSWHDCQKFLKKLNESAKLPQAMGKGQFDLPHEDQWEYACRGGRGNQPFYFGDKLNGTQANCIGKFPYGTEIEGPFLGRTTEVGSYEQIAPHPWNLCDMHGNVWQWCQNKFEDEDHENDRRILRGNCWYGEPSRCRSGYGLVDVPDHRSFGNGFRVVFLP